MAKTIAILRHAKAEVGAAHQDDHSRKLAPRGIEAAQIMGAYMFKEGIKPQKVICSDAMRTRETWAQIESIYCPPDIEYTRKLYMASANEMLLLLAALPEEISSVMLIAHNPGVHQLSLKLAKNGDEGLIDMLHLKFPTCALTIVDLAETPWANVASAQGTLKDFVTPKMLAGIGDD